MPAKRVYDGESATIEPEPEPDPEPIAEETRPAWAKVQSLGRRRKGLVSALEKTEAELWAAFAEADAEGTPKTAIAAAAGVTRQTVYNVLASREAS